ncbi:hypothetical protein C8R43DRAFT_1238695, partial [Mycena crocata]
ARGSKLGFWALFGFCGVPVSHSQCLLPLALIISPRLGVSHSLCVLFDLVERSHPPRPVLHHHTRRGPRQRTVSSIVRWPSIGVAIRDPS